MKITYYEAFGVTKVKLLELLDKRHKGIKRLIAWAKKQGGHLATSESGWGGIAVVLECEKDKQPKNPENWKQTKHGQWEPRHSTKEGKRLHAEIKEITGSMPVKGDLVEYLKIDHVEACDEGLLVPRLGTKQPGTRLLLAVRSNKYKPPKGIALKRISDVEYEKAGKKK